MKVHIKPEIFAEIDYYVQNSSGEVSGLGRMKRVGDTMQVSKIYLLDQVNSAASTDLDADAVASLMFETRADAEEHGALNFWWHSHVNMGVFWSGTDMATIKQFGKNGFLLATVFNKKREMRSALYVKGTEFTPDTFTDNIPTSVLYKADQEQVNTWDADLKAKSKKPKVKVRYTWPNTHVVGTVQGDVDGNHWGKGKIWNQDLGGWQTDEQHKAWKNRNKAAKDNQAGKQITLLTESVEERIMDMQEDEYEYETLLRSFCSDAQIAEWSTYYSELTSTDPLNVTYWELWDFYDEWQGDFQAMQSHVFTEMAEGDDYASNLQ